MIIEECVCGGRGGGGAEKGQGGGCGGITLKWGKEGKGGMMDKVREEKIIYLQFFKYILIVLINFM